VLTREPLRIECHQGFFQISPCVRSPSRVFPPWSVGINACAIVKEVRPVNRISVRIQRIECVVQLREGSQAACKGSLGRTLIISASEISSDGRGRNRAVVEGIERAGERTLSAVKAHGEPPSLAGAEKRQAMPPMEMG